MKLLVIGMNYAPEHTGIGPYTTELSEYLVQRGHQVTVATTFPHYPEWETHAAYAGKRVLDETRNGVTLKRRAVFLPKRATTIRRILYDTSLGVGAVLSGLGESEYDLVLGIAPPIQAGISARLLARRKRVPYVLLIQDLALEAAQSVGMLKGSAWTRLAQKIERWSYTGAARIIVISNGFQRNLRRKGVDPEKLVVLPNWADPIVSANGHRDNDFRHAQGIPEDAILVVHSGNMGVKQKLENVLGAAARLKAHSEISFALIGEGSQKKALEAQARSRGLNNVHFLPLQPSEEVPHMLAAADILLLNQHPDLVEAVAPSKLLNYMAAARPVIIAAHPESEAARQVRAAECGVWVDPRTPDALAQAILTLAGDEGRRAALGAQGRVFVEQNYTRERLLQAYEANLVGAVTPL